MGGSERLLGQHQRQETQDLIEKIYASALEPGRYDELMEMWRKHVELALESIGEPEPPLATDAGDALSNAELERHFYRAFSILERLGRANDDSRSIEALIEVNPQPALLIGVDGQIIAANQAARLAFGQTSRISDLEFEAGGAQRVARALTGMPGQQAGRLLAVVRAASSEGESSFVLALTRAQRPEGAAPVGLMTVADLTWNERIGDLLRQAFGLTEAEALVARALVSGSAPRDIATTRASSLDTVRTQIKALLRKVGVRSQGELIRLTAALVQLDLTGQRPEGSPWAVSTSLTRPGGRRLDIVSAGPEHGRPVLFIHGMLDGHGMTDASRAELEKRAIRLIAPVRPRFGFSDPDGKPEGAPERFAEDVRAVLDHYGVDRCPVIGHMAGSLYAFAVAAALGPRITGIVNVSGGVPIVSHEQFSVMTPRQRIVAYTARYTPALLPLILRAGIALLDSGGEHAFMKALYEGAPIDYRIATRPEVFAALTDGYRFTVRQGHAAFEVDSWQVTRDWSHHVAKSRQPVALVHGRHDPVVRIATVRDFAGRTGARAQLVELAEEGQLLFYSRPQAVFDALEPMFD
jgi:pimeloyl-ACP methyl ester carboxylesterase/DNA-binding CsgD family transcriptional regulator